MVNLKQVELRINIMPNKSSDAPDGFNSKNSRESLPIAERRILELLSAIPVIGYPEEPTESVSLELYLFAISTLANDVLRIMKESYGTTKSNVLLFDKLL